MSSGTPASADTHQPNPDPMPFLIRPARLMNAVPDGPSGRTHSISFEVCPAGYAARPQLDRGLVRTRRPDPVRERVTDPVQT
jgi:hypothetical protein